MNQFCPKCCKWYYIDERFCPVCDVGLYFEREHKTTTNKGKQPKIISHQKFNSLRTTGIIKIVIGAILMIITMIAIGIASDSLNGAGILGTIVVGIIELVGIFFLTLGISSVSTYNYFKRTAPLPEYNPAPNTAQTPIVLPSKPTIFCPYCKSDNTVKLTAISRAGSIFIAGAASGKIGKQWHCNNCKSDF